MADPSSAVRIALAIALLLTLGPGAPAAADPGPGPNRRSCRTLAKQIAHFQTVAARARERDNELWERATLEHVARLRQRQRIRCPQDVPPTLGERVSAAFRELGEYARLAAFWQAF